MNSGSEKIFCPLISKEIERIICEDVSWASEGMQPERFVPSAILEINDWKEKCMGCPKHPK
ncbi:MAG: hypothetical protein IJU91_08170 [Selenomonadaceae bacterium]|nr:hypothetical protein [Selenomonadaceae bacterium]